MVFERPGDIGCIASPAIVAEWKALPSKVSVRGYFSRHGVSLERLVQAIDDLVYAAQIVHPIGEPPPCRDENDRKYLHACLEGNVDYLLTTDLDLLAIETIGRTRIVRPGMLWRLFNQD